MKPRLSRLPTLARLAIGLGVLLACAEAGRGAGSAPPVSAAPYEETLAAVGTAWAAGRFENVREELRRLLRRAELPAHVRSYAHLRLAQSRAAAGDPAGAAAEYARLAADPAYPEIHRAEAWACAAELERARQGLPPREPPAARAPVTPIAAFALELFVGPGGDDRGPGTRAAPFATPERARDELRARRTAGRLPAGPVAVRLLPGEYSRSCTFELTAADSGAPHAPIIFRADQPGTAVWYGGRRLPTPRPVTDSVVLARLPPASRDRVVQFDLTAAGLAAPLPPLQERGYGRRPPDATLELFCAGRPLTLARWPDAGFVDGGSVLEPGSLREGVPSRFTYLDDRHARWASAPDAWLGGYFAFGWADRTLRLRSIDVGRREVSCGPYELNGHAMKPESWFNQGRIRYYAFNLLEELDAPGEWYFDRARHRLYVLPPVGAAANYEVGWLPVPMVVARGVRDVRLEGLVFDLGQANGLEVHDSERVILAGCTVRRFAAEGIGIRGGRECGIFGCDVYLLGRNATTITGGDRTTLTPARHFVENCRLFEFGRLDRTYVPAVQLEGVGHRVAHNLMRDGPASAVRIEGNDHVLEFNRVHRVLLETEDQGAMELFGNATYRGVVFRHNVFSDIGGDPPMRGPAGRAALRFDDAISGMVVYGNLFVRAAQSFGAININGGRDHLVDNNLFVDCAKAITGGYHPGNAWWERLGSGPGLVVSELYLQRYPALARVREPPGLSAAWRNVFWRCGPLFTTYNRPTPENFAHLANVDCGQDDPGFVDAAAGDYRLRPGAPLFARVGFRPLPLDEAGPYAHTLRAAAP